MKKKTNRKVKTKKKKSIGRIILYVILFFMVIGLIGAGVLYKYVSDIIAETPPIEVFDINVLLSQNSFIYDNEGNVIEKVEDNGLRTVVPYEKIDEDMKKAIVAVEDKTFWEHNGFNYVRLVGAVVESLGSGGDPAGTSTITQQYARNMYLSDTRFASGAAKYKRKVREAYYAVDIEKNMTKEEILGAYLNTIEFGANAKGIQAACMRYFSKNSDEIDYIEAAILSGIAKANTTYSPFRIIKSENLKPDDYILGLDSSEYTIVFNEKCLKRYKVVLKVMYENGAITKEEYEYAKDYDIRERLKPTPLRSYTISSYFTDMVKQDVIKKFMEEKGMSKTDARNLLYRGGLRIHSTIDTNLQKKLDSIFEGKPFSQKFGNKTSNALKSFQKRYGLEPDGLAGGKTLDKMVDLGLILPTERPKAALKPGDESEEVLVVKKALEKAGYLFRRHPDLPRLSAYRDGKKNILKLDENRGYTTSTMLNYYDNIINTKKQLVISPDNYYMNDNGDIVFKKGKMFNFYSVYNAASKERELELFIKSAYRCDESSVVLLYRGGSYFNEKVSIPEMYIYNGSTVRIEKKYKSMNDKDEFVLSRDFLKDNPDAIEKTEDGNLLVNEKFYTVSSQGVIQPQAAMTVIDYRTGQLKAIAGGRNVEGQMIYNRAKNPRQPGSSIKPLGVYTPCLDNGYSPSSVVEDIPTFFNKGREWPKNWDKKYQGSITMRRAVTLSDNVAAVKFLKLIGEETGLSYLKKFGISTVKEDGTVNDINVSAIALGGMSYGATNFDMAGAYGAIANGGVRKETITFTKIYDKNGELLLENKAKEQFVVSEQVAWLMQDMLRSVVNEGVTRSVAPIKPGNTGIPVVGKTGTTSSHYDIWFCGYTPYYSSAMWIGSDINLRLSQSSISAAKFWSKINKSLHEGLPNKSFKGGAELGLIRASVDSKSGMLPSALSYKDPSGNGVITDWFIPGYQPKEVDNNRYTVTICKVTGKLATPYCPEHNRETIVLRRRTEEVPEEGRKRKIQDSAEVFPYEVPLPPEGTTIYPIDASIDYIEMGKLGLDDPYCFVHTGELRSAQLTSNILAGVPTVPRSDGGLIIAQSIFISNIFGTEFNADAGSVIYPDGTILTVHGVAIYPWQIESFRVNPDGPEYIPEEQNEENETGQNEEDGQNDSNEDNNDENQQDEIDIEE